MAGVSNVISKRNELKEVSEADAFVSTIEFK